MTRHYHLARLREGEGVRVEERGVHINLDAVTEADHIYNDEQMLAARAAGVYFFLSGGGTLLLNNRYLLVVQRDAQARINPGQWSLFTGRAEGLQEWSQPWRVTRELFEELQLFAHGEPLLPAYPPLQEIIDRAYGGKGIPLPLTPMPLTNRRITVSSAGGVTYSEPAFLIFNARGDINMLFLFAAEVEMEGLSALDRELEGDRAPRTIAVLDVHTNMLIPVSGTNPLPATGLDKRAMSENLTALLEALDNA